MVSIIVTTYNGGHFLTNALRSCLAQDVDKEIVVVDDCSTMHIPAVVHDFMYANKETQFIRNKSNLWLSETLNTGFRASRGEWVICLDEDDWFYPNALSSLLALSDNADIVYGSLMQDGRIAIPAPQPFSIELFKNCNPLWATSLTRRTVWESIGGYLTKNKAFYQDWNFWARACKAGFRFKRSDVLIYMHGSKPESMCHAIEPNINEAIKLSTEELYE